MMTAEEFDNWASGLGLRHVYPHELRVKCANGLNHLPPRHLFGNIVVAAHLVDSARKHFGKAVELHSTYRSIPYNRSKGSTDNSRHVFFNAIDHHIDGVDHRELRDYYKKVRSTGFFLGGIGLYSWGVHIDTRGYNADW